MENNQLESHKNKTHTDMKIFEDERPTNGNGNGTENEPDEVDSLEEGENNNNMANNDDIIGNQLKKLNLMSSDSNNHIDAAASEANISSCNTSTTSVSSDGGGGGTIEVANSKKQEMEPRKEIAQSMSLPLKTTTTTSSSSKSQSPNDDDDGELYDRFDQDRNLSKSAATSSATTIKRTHLLTLIFELYDLNENPTSQQDKLDHEHSGQDAAATSKQTPKVLIESYVEKLPPGKNLKNSILLAWKRKYFRLNSLGVLYVHDVVEEKGSSSGEGDRPMTRYRYRENADEVYNIMGGRVEYEQNRRVISLDDGRGNYLVFRCLSDDAAAPSASGGDTESMDAAASEKMFYAWRECIDAQIVDRSHALWVRPNQPLALLDHHRSLNNHLSRNVVIIDIGTCSIRAGLFDNEPKLPKLFVPTVCSKDLNGKLRVGFDAFDFLLGSSAPSTIDLRKSMSTWSLTSSQSSNQLIFPFKTRVAIDKLGIDMDSIEAIVSHVVESLNIACENYEVVVITTHKLSDKVNVQFLNLLLNEDKFKFKSATIINQTLMALYAYNSNVGVIANLGEKIDIVPICNGLPFQNGVTNLAYGGSCMSEFLNGFISRGHVNYVNDMEQFYIRYIKEKSCYTAFNYQDELIKYPNDAAKYTMELKGRLNEFKKVEFPESARFKTVEGLFTPEIWGQDGQGIHKLIQKAIQSSSMDLRREMARSVFLCGGMSRITGLRERLERELKLLFPPNLTVKVNCSEYSYHAAYLGAFRFIQQPEYEKLTIRREEWATENVNCLRKWRSI